MTCYSQIKQAEEQKRAEKERLNQQKMDYLRHQLHENYARQDLERERKAREEAEESRRLAILDAKKRVDPSDEMHKRKRWDDHKRKEMAVGEPLQIFTPLARKLKPATIVAPKKKDEQATYAARSLQREKPDEKKKTKPQAKPLEQANLSLSVAAGLPVSLSVGQKQVQVFLLGKNASTAPMAVGLEASILDSQKSTIASKAEPRTCTIEPEGESKIRVAFDLPEDAARGMLTFSAFLKENAIYIDKQAAQSNAVSLSSQVKSSMDLQYKQASAFFESGALKLAFKNVGESGGILEMSSSVTYFSQGSIGKKAALTARTKIKGGEKNIMLAFAPADEAILSSLEISLVGTDSNGKPYSLKRKINAKEPAVDEAVKTEKEEQREGKG
jgi:hypothetical protein